MTKHNDLVRDWMARCGDDLGLQASILSASDAELADSIIHNDGVGRDIRRSRLMQAFAAYRVAFESVE